MNNTDFYATYSFYDERKRRISAFAITDGDNINIYIFKCVKADNFCKKTAKDYLFNYLAVKDSETPPIVQPEIFIIEHNGKPRLSLIEFCQERYFVKKTGFSTKVFYNEFLYKKGRYFKYSSRVVNKIL